MGHDVLASINLPPFHPLPPFQSGWSQTIAARFWPQKRDLFSTHPHYIQLPDGDQIVTMESRLNVTRDSDRIIVLVHGLTGCYQSSYMIRIANKLVRAGYRVFRINLRGCGPGFGLARSLYHSGRSEDTRAVLLYLKQAFPLAPVTQIGFSLGANITLKMAGEDGNTPTGNLDSVIAISPPIELAHSAQHLGKEQNRFFDQFFVKELKTHVNRLHTHFPELEKPALPNNLSLFEFDDLYTAPRSGFKNAADYYKKSSSGPLIPYIKVQTLILSSMDDPIVDSATLRAIPNLPNLDLVLTERGGHVGFLGRPGENLRWMDSLVLRWLKYRYSPARI